MALLLWRIMECIIGFCTGIGPRQVGGEVVVRRVVAGCFPSTLCFVAE
jgi:hypothetical protein